MSVWSRIRLKSIYREQEEEEEEEETFLTIKLYILGIYLFNSRFQSNRYRYKKQKYQILLNFGITEITSIFFCLNVS
jgi:hypothetical protein